MCAPMLAARLRAQTRRHSSPSCPHPVRITDKVVQRSASTTSETNSMTQGCRCALHSHALTLAITLRGRRSIGIQHCSLRGGPPSSGRRARPLVVAASKESMIRPGCPALQYFMSVHSSTAGQATYARTFASGMSDMSRNFLLYLGICARTGSESACPRYIGSACKAHAGMISKARRQNLRVSRGGAKSGGERKLARDAFQAQKSMRADTRLLDGDCQERCRAPEGLW